ncbi:MAG TPA: helix-turn-helix transcriptional regulator [Methylomirabilota bacterium]|nr:helix-turn-helix transcriptional regulator [Methylomirabilota bacterium]
MSRKNLTGVDKKAIGFRLKLLREHAGLGQAEAAERLDLGRHSTLASYEQGDAEIPLSVLIALPMAYGFPVDVNSLLGVSALPQAQEIEPELEQVLRLVRRLYRQSRKGQRRHEWRVLVALLEPGESDTGHTE